MATSMKDFAIQQLRRFLSEPQWRNGGKLPSELQLAKEIGVSRPIVRQALATLRDEGLLTSKRGSGHYFQPLDKTASNIFGSSRSIKGVSDCFRFREVIECAAAAEAARVGDEEHLAHIEEAAQAMKASSINEQEAFEREFAFHLAIAEATRNPYFPMTLELLKPQIQTGFEIGRFLRDIPIHTTASQVVTEHIEIVEAIRKADASRAEKLMRNHLKRGRERFMGYED
ncbi:FCD domain-containing protein [Salinicola sp. 4072]|uniref:FadR/GntR family transcriptional regulator n=1 Tax=Salinicola sp. 4072 TaxID=3082157 RepID=UPI002FC65DD5